MRIGGDRSEPERRGGGTAISGPVKGHEPDAMPGRGLLTEGPVAVEHRGAAGIPGVTGPQYPVPTVYLNLAHPFSVLCNGGRLPGLGKTGICAGTLHGSPRRRPR